MARTRSLKPQFFKNDLLAECQPLARLLFSGLWCMADAEGRLEYRPLRVKAEVLPYDECDVDQLVDELEQRGFVRRYTVEDVTILVIPKFLDHQRPHPKEPTESFPPEENDGAGNKFVQAVNKSGTAGNKFVQAVYDCASYPSPFNPSPSNPSVMEPDKSAALPKRQPQKDSISWDSFEGWQGITDTDRDAWLIAYPAAALTTELAKAGEWLKSNPTKSKKSNWRKFLTGWLTRCQDGGGTRTGDPRVCVGASNPPPQAKRRYWRDKYTRNMTEEEFRLAEQALPEVKSLAAALEVR